MGQQEALERYSAAPAWTCRIPSRIPETGPARPERWSCLASYTRSRRAESTFPVPWQDIVGALKNPNGAPMPEATARHARDDLESLGMMEHAFPKGPRGGPTRKRGQNSDGRYAAPSAAMEAGGGPGMGPPGQL